MKYLIKYKYVGIVLVLLIVLIVLFLFDKEEVKSVDFSDDIVVKEESVDTIRIEVKGAVNNTGVFEIEEDARVIDAINLVGGVLKNADTNNINLSAKLMDSMVLDIPYIEEVNTNIKVDIKGCVNKPGVYSMKFDDRVIDVINKASGLSDCALTDSINLSKKIFDEMVIIIPDNIDDKISNDALIGGEQDKEIIDESDNLKEEINKKISINTASKEELMTLTGIGESKALAIIEYRSSKLFESIEEITNVSGIGKALFEKIKDNITL